MTRRYAAPELLNGGLRGSPSDVFSLACVFIEIFSALNESISYDDHGLFSDMMPGIHEQLNSINVSPKLSVLPEVIVNMSARISCKRWSAKRVQSTLVSQVGLSCRWCRSKGTDTSVEPWTPASSSTNTTHSSKAAILKEPATTVNEKTQDPYRFIRSLQDGGDGTYPITFEHIILYGQYHPRDLELQPYYTKADHFTREAPWMN
jgi:serine/threonine protein kinase